MYPAKMSRNVLRPPRIAGIMEAMGLHPWALSEQDVCASRAALLQSIVYPKARCARARARARLKEKKKERKRRRRGRREERKRRMKEKKENPFSFPV